MSPDDLLDQPLSLQATALRDSRCDCAALTEAFLARVAARDPALGAVVHLDAASARAAAKAADETLASGAETGPLHGLPVAIKDIIAIAGQPNTCGSHAADTALATQDARAVARLRAAGALIPARLATYEYALTGPAWDQPNPPPRNPWNPAHITGGSSSGSAAAVAGGLVRAALGTDTGGSIRSPAAYCGIVGLKPARGRVPDAGVFPLSRTLDTVGPLAACVADAALIHDVIADPAGTARATRLLGRDPSGLRLGYLRDWVADDPAAVPAMLSALDDGVGALSRLGLAVDLATLPAYPLFEQAGTVLLQAEALEVHAAALATRFDRYGTDARRNLMTGAVLTPEDVAAARTLAARLTEAVDAALTRADILVTATTLAPAPPFSAFEDGAVWTAMRTIPFNLTGHPAISLPCGFSGGLPLGMQLIARAGDEARLCQVAQAFEQATDHAVQRPPLL